MSQPKITFNRGEGGLGRPLAGEDHISGMMFYFGNATLPTGWAIPWTTATAYTKGDTVIESGNLYEVLKDHTSDATAILNDVTAGNVVANETVSQRTEILFSIEDLESRGVAQGASGILGVVWYHVDQFFKGNPQGVLYLAFFDDATQTDLEIVDLQQFAGGKLRQVGIFDHNVLFGTPTLTTIQGACDTLEAQDQPVSVIYHADMSAQAIATQPDLTALTNKNISVVAGEDGAAAGNALAVANGFSISALGRLLGDVSRAAVNESVAWVGQFPVSDGVEFDTPYFATGEKWSDQSASALEAFDAKGYIFLKKHTGKSNTYWNDTNTATAVTSDFATIENNRTIDKAVRQTRTFLLDKLNSPILVDPDSGNLSEAVIADFRADASRGLEDMQSAGEISGFAVLIDPTQDVLSTSQIVVTIQIVPVGVARTITVNIGFTVSLS